MRDRAGRRQTGSPGFYLRCQRPTPGGKGNRIQQFFHVVRLAGAVGVKALRHVGIEAGDNPNISRPVDGGDFNIDDGQLRQVKRSKPLKRRHGFPAPGRCPFQPARIDARLGIQRLLKPFRPPLKAAETLARHDDGYPLRVGQIDHALLVLGGSVQPFLVKIGWVA